jgi:1,2-phenylacetyl-CoA epoxidase catalytic subunit
VSDAVAAQPADETHTAAPAGETDTHEQLFFETLCWLADATLLVHTVEEARVIPIAPRADDMWELGKLCSERMGLFQKVNRVARSHGRPLVGRERDASRHFLLGGNKLTSWEEALVTEVVVGHYFRLFFESFLRASNEQLGELAKTLWHESQPFIRFGQARISRVLAAGGDIDAFQAGVDKWLPVVVDLLDEVPDDLDARWANAGYREKPNSAIRSDYLEEMATYLNATDLEVPASCCDVVPVAEVRWVGADITPARTGGRPLQDATFAFSKKQTGRDTVSGRNADQATDVSG